jgi:hypothetical protein
MPSNDLAINVRQIAGYTPAARAVSSDVLLLQQGGLGGPYASISPVALVGTALSGGGDMFVGGMVSAQTFQGGMATFANSNVNLFGAQRACIGNLQATFGTVGGVPIATTADVALARASTVWSFNGRMGDVRLWIDDIRCAGGAPIFSPRFTGCPRADTPGPDSNSTRLATTLFVNTAILNAFATFLDGTNIVSSFNGRTGAVVLTEQDILDAGGTAIFDSPTFTGVPLAPTATAGTNNTQIATTAFVVAALASSGGVSSFNSRAGAITLTSGDITGAGGALLASPAFTGNPAAPTAAPATNTTQIATCAFVQAAIGTVPAPSGANPLMNGVAAPGTLAAYSRGDHVHPVDTSRYSASNPSGFQTAAQVTASLANYLPLVGGSLSGGFYAPAITVLPIGAADPVGFAIFNSAATALAQWTCSTSTGAVTFTANIIGGQLGLAGDITITPGAGHNLLLNSGVGFQAGGGPWLSLSDARIKTVEADYEAGLDELSELRPVVYTYNGADGASSLNAFAAQQRTRFVGLIAQEVEAVMPDMVTTRNGVIDGQPVSDLRVLNTTALTFALINAVKQLAQRVRALEGGQT